MADNASDAIKQLGDRINSLDRGLVDMHSNITRIFQDLKAQGANLGDIFSAIEKRTQMASKAAQVRMIAEFVDKDGKPLTKSVVEDRITKLTKVIDSNVKTIKIGADVVGSERYRSLINDYKEYLKLLNKTDAQIFDLVNRSVNGGKQSTASPEWIAAERSRTAARNQRKKAIDDVTRAEGQLLSLEQQLSRYKEGSKRWRETTAAIEKTTKQLDLYNKKLRIIDPRIKSPTDAPNMGVDGYSKETKKLIQEGREATREAERLAKVRQKDAQWHEQQRKNTEAQFIANGKAIEQQRKLADQIDQISRKRNDLIRSNSAGGIATMSNSDMALYNAYEKKINELRLLQAEIEKTFSGSTSAGTKSFVESGTKAYRDATELSKQAAEAKKQQAQADKEAEKAARALREEEERIAKAQREVRVRESKAAYNTQAKADKESLEIQKRQIDIKNRLRQIDNERAARAKYNKDATKQELEAERQEYKHLNQELTKLIAKQKELDAISKGSGSRARVKLETYETNQADKAAQRYANSLKLLEEEKRRLNRTTTNLIPTLQRLASAFGVVFSVQGLVNFGKKLVETRGQFEKQFVAMKQIIQDTDAATKIWNQTMQQALNSPFKAMQLVDYTKKLAAYRIETDKLFDTTKRLADVSAGLGVDMQRLILAYGQVKAANYLRASEVRQFTEAGVNIYGELAKYFSEIEGRVVGTAEVVERVTKRMVLFSDVEKIFQRMTDEGGVFFNMQEVQANTVWGQIQKLHDAYDQMLNTIGQANQGTIRDFVEALNSLVRNWQNVAYVLKWNVNWVTLFGSALMLLSRNYLKNATTQTLWFGKAILGNKNALLSTTKDVKIFSRAIGDYTLKQRVAIVATRSLQGALSSLGGMFMAIWPLLAFEVIVLGIERLTRANRELKRMREELEDVASSNTNQMNEEINGYNSLIEKLKKTTEGTQARKEVLDKISQKYGKYLNFIVSETTSVEDLAEAYDKVVSSIRNYTAEKIREEQRQLVEKEIYDEYQDLIGSLTGASIADRNGIQRIISKAQAQNIARLVQENLEKYDAVDIPEVLNTYFDDEFKFTNLGENRGVVKYVRGFVSTWKDLKQELDNIRDEIELETPTFKTNKEYNDYLKRVKEYNSDLLKLEEEYNKNVDEIKNRHRSEDDSWKIENDLNELRILHEQDILDTKLHYELITVKQHTEAIDQLYGKLDDYESDYNARLESALSTSFGPEWKTSSKDAWDMYTYVVSTEDVLQQGTLQRNKQLVESYTGLKESLKEYQAQMDAAQNSGASKGAITQIQGGIDWATLMKKAIELAAQLRGLDLSDKKKGSTAHNYKNISSLISLLKEMNSEYDKLSKSAYGYAKSQQKVNEAFSPAFKEIFGFAGIDISQANTWSKKGLADTMKMVIDTFDNKKLWGKFGKNGGKEARDAFVKAWGKEEAEADIALSVRVREDFGRQMEELFSNYSMTVELEGLHLDPAAAQEWLGLEATSLADMLAEANAFADKQISDKQMLGGAFDEEDLKAYQNWTNKIEQEILKQRKDKVKEYSKYLEKELSERAKLEMEYAAKTAEIQASTLFVGDQKRAILDNMEREYTEAMQELTWESFRESTFYVEMMDDLTSIPAEYSEIMLSKINDLLLKPNALSPRAFKEAINARQKIYEAQRQMNPARAMSSNLTALRTAVADGSLGFTPTSKSYRGFKKELDEAVLSQTKLVDGLEEQDHQYQHLTAQITNYENAERAANDALKGLGGTLEENTAVGLQEEIDNRKALLAINEEEDKRYQDLMSKSQSGTLTDEEKVELEDLSKNISIRRKSNEELRTEIMLYTQALQARQKYDRAVGILDKEENADAKTLIEGGSVEIGGVNVTRENLPQNANNNRQQLSNAKKNLQTMKSAKRNSEEFALAWHQFNAELGDTLGKVGSMGNAFYETFEALGGETDALTEGWRDFGNTMIDVITQSLTMIPTLVTGFTAAGVSINSAMGIIGLIAEAIQLVITLIGALAKLHDAAYEKEIENQQKKIDDLKNAYERLEKAIEKTWSSYTYVRTYEQQVQNLRDQITALEAQRRAEQSKKNTDDEKVRDYTNSIQEAYDEIEELQQKSIEVFGGIGEEDYRSAAEEFVSAWKDAFLETGDGLSGLQDHFDEFLQDWFVKQATMRIAGNMLNPLFEQIDRAVDKYGTGGVDVMMEELANVREQAAAIFPDLSAALEELAGMWNLEGEGGLSGLAAGIQGITEEQANILEAYWNSVRMYTASIDMNVARIADILGAGGVNTNPQLQQLQVIANNTQAMYQLLQSTTKSGHSQGGYGFKVFND